MRDDDRSLEPAMAPLQAITCSRAGHWSRTFSDLTRNWANGHGCLIRSRSYALPFVVFALGLLVYTKLYPGTYGKRQQLGGLAHALRRNSAGTTSFLRQTPVFRFCGYGSGLGVIGVFWAASCDVEEACCSAPAKENDLIVFLLP